MTAHRPPAVIDGALLLQWMRRSVSVLQQRREEINELNVFPVADSDTGSNMLATLQSALAKAEEAHDAGQASAGDSNSSRANVVEVAAALASGAVTGSRGNSGTVLSQVFRALAESVQNPGITAEDIAAALRLAVRHVDAAIADPVEGTILTVLRHAASAASEAVEESSQTQDEHLLHMLTQTADAARTALEHTPSQLPALRKAGVVDAGGAGLVLLLDALVDEVSGAESVAVDLHVAQASPMENELEVMYLIELADDYSAEQLKEALQPLGNSLIVAGQDQKNYRVHIHSVDAGAVIETSLPFGTLRDIRIEVLFDEPTQRDDRTRLVVAMAPEGDLAGLFSSAGAKVISPNPAVDVIDHLIRELAAQPPNMEVLFLPNGLLPQRNLVQLELAAQAGGHSLTIVPTASLANGVAAMAVHDASRPLAVDAYAMSEAATGMRTAYLERATKAGLTQAGPCAAGDVLVTIGKDIIAIADTIESAVITCTDLMLAPGGEMITVLLGDGVAPEVALLLRNHVAQLDREIDCVAYSGNGMRELIQIGVE